MISYLCRDPYRTVVTDLRKLNLLLKRLSSYPYPISKVGDMIRSMEGFTLTTELNLNMGYHQIKLVADAQRLCKFVLTW
jgi:hypothetical protein